MARIIIRLFLSVSVLGALLVLVTYILGIFQPSTEIAYVCDFPALNLYAQLCLTDADRGITVQLTHDPQLAVENIAWSPDGSQIIFEGYNLYYAPTGVENHYSESDLYLLDVSGGAVNIAAANAQAPAWSSDGTQIAFNTVNSNYPNIENDLDTFAFGGSLHMLLHLPQSIYNPTWSPDGTKVAFQVSDSPYMARSVIYWADADGSHLRRVTPADNVYVDPAWSPDGSKLAYMWAGQWNLDIVLLDLKTGVEQNLTANFFGRGSYEGSPSWSPDGSRIAFDSDGCRGFWQPRDWWVYVIKADGSGVYVVAQGRRPAWRPSRVISLHDFLH